jgi:oxygen-independent coproporphyrinogen III oxidase
MYKSSWSGFDTLYIGGGTPSLLEIRHFENLLEHVHQHFHITDDAEITIEVNPADICPADLRTLRLLGVNRISIGVQSFYDDILSFLGRRHTGTQAISAIDDARQAGFENIAIDMIYGVPGQDLSSWEKTLHDAISFKPEHISCYQLTLGTDTHLGMKCRNGEFLLPSDELQYKYFMMTSSILADAGYIHYEVSNFSRSTDLSSKHNSKYWNHSPYLGLGPSAHSFAGSKRWWNKASLDEYLADIDRKLPPVASSESLSSDELRQEAMFLRLRTREGIDVSDFNTRFHCDLLEEKAEMLSALQDSGFIRIEDGYLRPTSCGMAIADSLALI